VERGWPIHSSTEPQFLSLFAAFGFAAFGFQGSFEQALLRLKR